MTRGFKILIKGSQDSLYQWWNFILNSVQQRFQNVFFICLSPSSYRQFGYFQLIVRNYWYFSAYEIPWITVGFNVTFKSLVPRFLLGLNKGKKKLTFLFRIFIHKNSFELTMGSGSSPSSILFIFCTISLGLWFGIFVIHPVPIPSAPLTSTIGIIGMYHSGSIFWLSSLLYFKRGSSWTWNISLVRGLRRVNI